ncbi:MAG: addiction module protein [Planctomycetes bacterium]|nr:addiction module protein [Planctomycetota bacterium]
MRKPPLKLETLTVNQRLGILKDVWESLSSTPENIPLTHEQRAELDRRLDEVDADDTTGVPWDQVVRRIRRRKR